MNKKNIAIVLVHGLWMTGLELLYLRLRFWLKGYRTYVFHYHSLLKTPAQNAAKLEKFVSNIDEPVVHFIAHSLGGLVVSHLFDQQPPARAGKIVFLASPLNGSAVAHSLADRKLFRYILGKSVIKGLLGDGPRWKSRHPVCVIAGSNTRGVGYLLAREVMQPINDGTVNLAETFLENADESHLVPHTHFSLLLSNRVIEIIDVFFCKHI